MTKETEESFLALHLLVGNLEANLSSSKKHSNQFNKPGPAGEMIKTREGIEGSSILSSLHAIEFSE